MVEGKAEIDGVNSNKETGGEGGGCGCERVRGGNREKERWKWEGWRERVSE